MQKLTCLLLALVMVLSLGITAFAEGTKNVAEGPASFTDKSGKELPNGNGTIKIKDATPTEEYSLYQILYLEDYGVPADAKPDSDGNYAAGNYAYKFNTQWKTFINYTMDINGTTYQVANALSVDDKGYVTWNGDNTKARAGILAKMALQYAKDNNILPIETKTAGAEPNNAVEFTGLKLGYFLVDTSLGSLCALDTTNPNAFMEEKNPVPTNEKQVKEDTWGTENDAAIGDTVEFRSKVTIATGTDHLIFHDVMTEGLTLDVGSVKVCTDANGENVLTNTDPVKYVITEAADKKDEDAEDCTFHVEFQKEWLDRINEQTTLYVFYTATLNSKAEVKTENNQNTSKLTYGDKHHATPDSTTVTKTWEIPVYKYFLDAQNSNVKTALKGAKFQIRKVTQASGHEVPEAVDDAIKLIKLADKTYEETIGGSTENYTYEMYRVATPDDTGAIDTIETGTSGRFRIQGLDSGSYELIETVAPDGFNRLTDPIPIEIQKDGTVKYNNTTVTGTIEVQNGTGSKMPSTGGMGTTIFYVVGSILLIGAGVLLVTKRRMSVD